MKIKMKYQVSFLAVAISLLSLAAPQVCAEQSSADTQTFEKIFADWTTAFNSRNLADTSKLFSKDCTASSPGMPHRTYESITALFKKLFSQSEETYLYRYKLGRIIRSGDLATVRIAWFLDVSKGGKIIAQREEQGLDVLQRDKTGNWQIVNFIAFSEDIGKFKSTPPKK